MQIIASALDHGSIAAYVLMFMILYPPLAIICMYLYDMIRRKDR